MDVLEGRLTAFDPVLQDAPPFLREKCKELARAIQAQLRLSARLMAPGPTTPRSFSGPICRPRRRVSAEIRKRCSAPTRRPSLGSRKAQPSCGRLVLLAGQELLLSLLRAAHTWITEYESRKTSHEELLQRIHACAVPVLPDRPAAERPSWALWALAPFCTGGRGFPTVPSLASFSAASCWFRRSAFVDADHQAWKRSASALGRPALAAFFRGMAYTNRHALPPSAPSAGLRSLDCARQEALQQMSSAASTTLTDRERQRHHARYALWVQWQEQDQPLPPAARFPEKWPPETRFYLELISRPIARVDVEAVVKQKARKPTNILVTRDPARHRRLGHARSVLHHLRRRMNYKGILDPPLRLRHHPRESSQRRRTLSSPPS